MKQNHNLKLLVLVVLLIFTLFHAHVALAMSDKVIKQRIKDQVTNTFRLKGANVDIAVQGGFVVLSGTVGFYIQKMLFEQIAWKTNGVVEVDNEIRVMPRVPLNDTTIEHKIMKLVQTHRRFQDINLKVTVTGGAVYIRTTLNHVQDVMFLKNKVAEIEGVTFINIQAKFIV